MLPDIPPPPPDYTYVRDANKLLPVLDCLMKRDLAEMCSKNLAIIHLLYADLTSKKKMVQSYHPSLKSCDQKCQRYENALVNF